MSKGRCTSRVDGLGVTTLPVTDGSLWWVNLPRLVSWTNGVRPSRTQFPRFPTYCVQVQGIRVGVTLRGGGGVPPYACLSVP